MNSSRLALACLAASLAGTVFSPVASGQTTGAESGLIASFEGEVPTALGWRKYGELPIAIVTEGEKKALDFNDEWETDWMSLTYKPSPSQTDAMATRGLVIETRVRHAYSGANGANFRILARIPGMVAPFIVFYGDSSTGGARISVYDSVEKKSHALAYQPEPDGYVTLRATYRPPALEQENGVFALEVGGVALGEFGVAPASVGQSGLEIGGIGEGAKDRTGQTLVQYLRLKTP